MRETLDPKRHYKKEESRALVPEYSQVGTVVEGPAEFFSGRIENKKRKKTLVEEIMEVEGETRRFKRKYDEIQSKKTSGKKAFYQKLKEQRRKKLGKR